MSLMEVIHNLAGAGGAEEEVAECVSELPPEERPSLHQRCGLQERLGTRRAASPRLPCPVHPPVRDLSVVRSLTAVAPETASDVLPAHAPRLVKHREKKNAFLSSVFKTCNACSKSSVCAAMCF